MKINTGGNSQPNNNGNLSLGGNNSNPVNPTNSNQGGGQKPSGGGISLQKGQKISLTKNNPTLDSILVGLGWDVNSYVGQDFDLDAQVFMLDENEKVPSNDFFIFYNQNKSPEGSVEHTGDNRTGQGEGDDESVNIQLQSVPQNIQKILFTVTIHDGKQRSQSFGQVKNAFIRIVDKQSNNELLRYDLTEDFSVETALVVGELYRHNGEWKFNAVGAGYQDELVDFCNRYGVQL